MNGEGKVTIIRRNKVSKKKIKKKNTKLPKGGWRERTKLSRWCLFSFFLKIKLYVS